MHFKRPWHRKAVQCAERNQFGLRSRQAQQPAALLYLQHDSFLSVSQKAEQKVAICISLWWTPKQTALNFVSDNSAGKMNQFPSPVGICACHVQQLSKPFRNYSSVGLRESTHSTLSGAQIAAWSLQPHGARFARPEWSIYLFLGVPG